MINSAAAQSITKCQSYVGFNGCVQVLFDAFAVENVPTFCLDGILHHIVAQSAHGGFTLFAEHAGIVLAADYEIGMAGHLTHARNQTEDIGVVCSCPRVIRCNSIWSTRLTVEQRSSINVRAELPLCIRKQA